ncbi:ABC transporter permease [Microbacterium allomyrinae]|uniref:ABC transporter permease n=1 Tax=Microbacterium allomyrinae TaxID=2830666 RepID=A0A9X1LSW9_9MICO|nr:ABC transporter permease [Microbacterium allomyrinae]MCC2030935.1 ABC transporter permease [Microbacterium allomyrinae]
MRFFLQRAAFYLFTLWAAITINFFLPRMMKGDPITAYLARNQGKVSPEAVESLKILFGLEQDRSLWDQYVQYWALLLQGDLGRSLSKGLVPVTEVIADALPWTLGLVGIATIISFFVGTVVGTYIGWRRGSKAEGVIPAATFLSTVPYFWLGLIMIAVFSTTLGWFPASHAYDKTLQPGWDWEFIGSVIYHGTLPALTIVITSLGGWILGMRNMMITVLDEDYVTVAQAKGLPPRQVVTQYAARNAVLPQLSSFALALGFIVGGTLILEMIFSYPGLGLRLFEATLAKDYPLMQGIFLVITLSVLVANIIADIAYAAMDPRTRQEEAQ